MKKAIYTALLGLIFILSTVAALYDNEIPDTVTFESERGDVPFPHKAHHELDYACQRCHHTVAEEMSEPDKTCHECHTASSDVSVQDAFHKACRDCHRSYKKEHRDTKAPTSCSKCHSG